MRTFEARLAAASPWLMGGMLAAFYGWLSMSRFAGQAICGLHQGAGHCGACYAAVAFLFIGCMTFATPRLRLKRLAIRSR